MTRKTRAHERAPAMEVVSVKTLPGERRVPKVLVTVRIGPVCIVCSFARYRRQRVHGALTPGGSYTRGCALAGRRSPCA